MPIKPQQYQLLSNSGHQIRVRQLGEREYLSTQSAMREFAASHKPQNTDEIWVLEHPRVYTQGTACQQDTLFPSDIPIVKSDRGGQITYHGPGQIVIYPLLHLKRYGMGVKALVRNLEQAVIDLLQEQDICGERREDAPGVYVDQAKIAALGLRIKRGNSYHGLSLNVDMDLKPFSNIDPCGYQGLQVTQLRDHGWPLESQKTIEILLNKFANLL